jgi:hypothetical protein
MARPAAGGRGRGDDHPALLDPPDPADLLGGGSDLVAFAEEHHHLEAELAREVDVGRGADVLAPAMLGGGEATLHVVRPVIEEDGHRADRVRVGIGERRVRELAPDEEADGVRAALRPPSAAPPVEGLEERGLERDRRAHDARRHATSGGRSSAPTRRGSKPSSSYRRTR